MFAKGIDPVKMSKQIQKARNSIGNWTTVYYDFTGCNCQHWVTYWRYGRAWSIQSNQPPRRHSNCGMPNSITEHPNAKAAAMAEGFQASARAEASFGTAIGGLGVWNGSFGRSSSFENENMKKSV